MRVATICARAGSKRLPGKNTRLLNGWPLYMWACNQAFYSGMFNAIILSTDDEEILAAPPVAAHMTIRRPSVLSTDEAGKVPVIRHALHEAERIGGVEYSHIVDIDVSAPLRTTMDIIEFCDKLDTMQSGNLVSVCKARKSPYFNMIERYPYDGFELCKHAKQRTVLRSQDAPEVFELNASMYGWNRADLLKGNDTVIGPETDIYEMPRERSWDIDDAHDLEIVAFLMSKQRGLTNGAPLVAVEESIRDIEMYVGGVTWVDSEYDERTG
jgi:CMP-N,N'-diacetyllegionaminic acid synthase